MLNEEELIKRAKLNSEDFKPLYERYYKKIFKFIFRKLDNKDETADITSLVFIKALVNINNYQTRSLPFSAWLYRIAHNEVMLYFRKVKKERTVYISEEMLFRISEETDEHDLEYLKLKLKKIIEHLNAGELEMIELRFYEGLSFYQIGMILNITENNAKVKMHRILEKIRFKIDLSHS